MAVKIQIRRGAGTVPDLDEGELGFATDTKEVFIGTATAENVQILTGISRQVLQGQIAGKADTLHDHPIEQVTGLLDALIDLENGKSNVGHTHVKEDITDFAHTHVEADITDLDKYTQQEVDDLLDDKSDVGHTHVKEDITDFDEHTHLKADITDFAHTHAISEITNLQTSLDAKLNTSLKGQANGLAELDAFGKLKVSQIPDYIKGSMSLVGFINLSSTTSSTPTPLSSIFQNFPIFEDFSEFESVIGSYVIVTEGGFLRNSDPDPDSLVGYSFLLGDDGVDADPTTGLLKVEKGDWVIFVEGTQPTSSIKYYNFTVLNNTYTEASSTDFGVVKLGGGFSPDAGVYPVIRDSELISGSSGVTGGLIVHLPKLIDANNIVTETQFATLTREAGVVYGAYNETTRVITWYFGV
jgi:hypothetical protein